ncbi:MAG: multidrug transporter [Chloroflexi bacterium]|nr:multidrug transporter [Chloroflexota bacterium]
MRKVILRRDRFVNPFNEPARDLRVFNKPLWLHQRDSLAHFTTEEREAADLSAIPADGVESLVHADNLWFDEGFLAHFMSRARAAGGPCRAAIPADDRAFVQHALPLSDSYCRDGDLYYADLWYFPRGVEPGAPVKPVVIPFEPREIGYYHIPSYMAKEQGDLVFQVPVHSAIAIDHWVHIFIADCVFGLFGRVRRVEDQLVDDALFKLRILWRALYEQKQVLSSSKLVKVGRNCVIDPTAVIHGPTAIGDNCNIGAGVVIQNCEIGSHVNISEGCQLMLSTVGDGCFLPFRAALFMTTLMENTMVAQNTCLQMCVVGRDTFIGAGNTFTDYNLIDVPLRAVVGEKLDEANRPVLGGCVGHNCRLGSGLIIYPARTIESDVVLFASPERRVIDKNVTYEQSDHHKLRAAHLHPRLYPREGEETRKHW